MGQVVQAPAGPPAQTGTVPGPHLGRHHRHVDMPLLQGFQKAAGSWSCEWRPGLGRSGHVQEDRAAWLTTRGSVTKCGKWNRPSVSAPEVEASHWAYA